MVEFDAELVRRFDRPGPRYTSYPTADRFVEAFGEERIFGIENYSRQNAVSDALATAQLLLVVLAEANARGLGTWAQLMSLQRNQRWLNSSTRL